MNDHISGTSPEIQPGTRAGDADRERVVQALHRHTAEGRLSIDEFAQRADAAHRAVTHSDLAALTADLPADPPQPRRVPRGPVAAALAAAAVAAVLLGTGVAAQAAGWAHMDSMMSAMGAGVPGCG